MLKMSSKIFAVLLLALTGCQALSPSTQIATGAATADPDPLLSSWLQQANIADLATQPEKYRLQMQLTEIRRDSSGQPELKEHSYRTNQDYLYPASTVKLAIAALALEYLHQLAPYGVSKDSTMLTEPLLADDQWVKQDPSAADLRPTVAHYIKKILLVSDNDAYNRLYELLGQQRINQRLHQLGFTEAQILHRLERPLPPELNRQTNAVSFYDQTGQLLYRQPAQTAEAQSKRPYQPVGNAYYAGDSLVPQPMDFSEKNLWRLTDMHRLIQLLMLPESQTSTGTARLNLSDDDRAFLQRYMALTPPQSTDPVYDAKQYPHHYVKFLYYGANETAPSTPGLRIYNKVGDAYGFLLDSAYFHYQAPDGKITEFILSVGLYVNSDGVLNDNQYDYQQLGLPLMQKLGQLALRDLSARP